MAYLDQPININELPEDTGGDFSPLPEGEYDVTIKDAPIALTKDGTGQYIKLRLDVTGPTHQGRVIFSNINIRNKSETAERIGRSQLHSIMSACGLVTLEDTDQLIGGSLTVKLTIRPARTDPATGKRYEASNDVKSYRSSAGNTSARPASAMPMPSSRPAATAPAPAAQAGGSMPPWMKR